MDIIESRDVRSRRPVSLLVSILLALATTVLVSLSAPAAQAAIAFQSSSLNMTNPRRGTRQRR